MKVFFATGLVFLSCSYVWADGRDSTVEAQARAYSVGAQCDCPAEHRVDQPLPNEEQPSPSAQFLKHQADEFGKGRSAMPVNIQKN